MDKQNIDRMESCIYCILETRERENIEIIRCYRNDITNMECNTCKYYTPRKNREEWIYAYSNKDGDIFFTPEFYNIVHKKLL